MRIYGIVRLRAAVRKRGWRGLAVLVLSKLQDRAFDLRYGTDTCAGAALASLTGTAGDIDHAEPYQPTQVAALRKLLRHLRLEPGAVLVDFGSGKGRVLMVAAQHGFRAVRGVEFSSGLCEIARGNVARFRSKAAVRAAFEIIHGDAAEYEVRDDETVFFLFNPFDDHVLRRVMRNIARSYAAAPRRMLLIYRRPVHQAWITRDTPFVRTGTHVYWDSDFAVFEAPPRLPDPFPRAGAGCSSM
jgi:hypothetical protein